MGGAIFTSMANITETTSQLNKHMTEGLVSQLVVSGVSEPRARDLASTIDPMPENDGPEPEGDLDELLTAGYVDHANTVGISQF